MTSEQDATMRALRTAIQMEIDGKDFYLKASQSSRNALGKKLLETLAGEEDNHRQVFERIYQDISNRHNWPKAAFRSDGGSSLRTVFVRALETMDQDVMALDTELDAIQIAMGMENKTYDYYRSQGARAKHDAERQFYAELAMQEEEHHRVLLDYYEFLKDPAAWFVRKEHPSLDGG